MDKDTLKMAKELERQIEENEEKLSKIEKMGTYLQNISINKDYSNHSDRVFFPKSIQVSTLVTMVKEAIREEIKRDRAELDKL